MYETMPLDDRDAGPGRDYRREAGLIVIANPNALAGICTAAR
jgi:hypothetical protein